MGGAASDTEEPVPAKAQQTVNKDVQFPSTKMSTWSPFHDTCTTLMDSPEQRCREIMLLTTVPSSPGSHKFTTTRPLSLMLEGSVLGYRSDFLTWAQCLLTNRLDADIARQRWKCFRTKNSQNLNQQMYKNPWRVVRINKLTVIFKEHLGAISVSLSTPPPWELAFFAVALVHL